MDASIGIRIWCSFRIKTWPFPAVNEGMGTRLAIGAYIGLAVYCLLSLFLGPMGMVAYMDLDHRVRGMRENLAYLESLNAESRARKDSALSDPEALALEARSLGYIERGLVVVRLGFPEGSPSPRDPGTIIPYTSPPGMEDSRMKAVSLVAGLCAAFVSLLIRGPAAGKERGRLGKGRPDPGVGSLTGSGAG